MKKYRSITFRNLYIFKKFKFFNIIYDKKLFNNMNYEIITSYSRKFSNWKRVLS